MCGESGFKFFGVDERCDAMACDARRIALDFCHCWRRVSQLSWAMTKGPILWCSCLDRFPKKRMYSKPVESFYLLKSLGGRLRPHPQEDVASDDFGCEGNSALQHLGYSRPKKVSGIRRS